MKNRDKLILQYGKLLLSYKNHVKGTPGNIVNEDLVIHNYQNDPIFNRVVDKLLSIREDGLVDYIEEPLSVNDSLQVIDEASVSFTYNDKSKVVLIRDGGNSIDFYPTTNKWEDNNDRNKIHYGNARKLIQFMEF